MQRIINESRYREQESLSLCKKKLKIEKYKSQLIKLPRNHLFKQANLKNHNCKFNLLLKAFIEITKTSLYQLPVKIVLTNSLMNSFRKLKLF